MSSDSSPVVSGGAALPDDLAARLARVTEEERRLRVRARWIIVQRGMVMLGARNRIKVSRGGVQRAAQLL